MAGETILIIDDDGDIREVLTIYLEKEGYQVISAMDGHQGVSYALSANPDLILLDMMLPGLDGIEVCQEIRNNSSVPIIFLSCKWSALDKSMGLMAGGDDYMGKPFDGLELLARVKAHLRRNRMLKKDISHSLLLYPGLTIDLARLSVEVDGQGVVLSPKEFQLLALLAQSPNMVFGSEKLFQSLWSTDSLGDHRTIMVHISNLRRKIEKDPANPVYIKTVKGAGYKFTIPAPN